MTKNIKVKIKLHDAIYGQLGLIVCYKEFDGNLVRREVSMSEPSACVKSAPKIESHKEMGETGN